MAFSEENQLACPFFVPREMVNDGSWPHPGRLPLGAGWTGACCAGGHETATQVDAARTRDFCNLGYASGCPHLPATRDWDAVRFCVAGNSPDQITICYVCELGHSPVEHGNITYDVAAEVWRQPPQDPRVYRLANSYLHAYRARQRGASLSAS
jgi:hypothetical protein